MILHIFLDLPCGPDYEHLTWDGGQACYYLGNRKLTFDEGRKFCQNEVKYFGDLANINSEAENLVVTKWIRSKGNTQISKKSNNE